MRTAIAIRHVAFEDLGTLEAALHAHGYAVSYREAGVDDLAAIHPAGADLLIVLGGPISVNDGEDHPFIEHEIRLLRARLAEDRPTLGICLGAQLMARALGAAVRVGPEKEIGWTPIALTEAGRRHPLHHLGEDAPVFHWHGETFDLPPGAALLASTPVCANQAFAAGRRALGLQFHPEVTAAGLERWYIGHAAELGAAGVRVPELRQGSARHAPPLARRAALLWDAWLASI